VRQVALGQVRQSRMCGIYAIPEHFTDMCPQLQEDVTPHVNAIGGFNECCIKVVS